MSDRDRRRTDDGDDVHGAPELMETCRGPFIDLRTGLFVARLVEGPMGVRDVGGGGGGGPISQHPPRGGRSRAELLSPRCKGSCWRRRRGSVGAREEGRAAILAAPPPRAPGLTH